MILPKDPYMLLSYVNTKLRDDYSSLEALSEDLDVSAEKIESALAQAGYYYDRGRNAFLK